MQLVVLNDSLRLHDNPLLSGFRGPAAAAVVLDKSAFFGTQYGIYRANLMRLQQQLAVIAELQASLAQQNIGLITLIGDYAASILSLAQALDAASVRCVEPVTTFEGRALSALQSQLDVKLLDSNSLLGEELRPQLHLVADSFTPFRKRLEPALKVSATQAATPEHTAWLTPEQTKRYNAAFNQLLVKYGAAHHCKVAAEAQALRHLDNYIWQQKHILHYKQSRNALFGDNYASFVSTPLALGTLSVRWLWQQIEQFEQQVTTNESTYWLKFELLWREFFRWQQRKYGQRWFSKHGIKGEPDYATPYLTDPERNKFTRWCAGNTGEAFIDANMRLLNQTGLMSNRGRQNVASYLIHDLALDWRLGAAYFEQRLLDYDCASNWCNWAYIAGVGNSASARPFNIQKQAQQYDAEGEFVRSMLRNATP